MYNARYIIACLACAAVAVAGKAQHGSISAEMLSKFADDYKPTAAEKALHNALNVADINTLAANADTRYTVDDEFSHRVPTKGITNQKSSGRCWLFSGLNVLRSQAINKYELNNLELSQAYNFFWDQLEKSNLFLQSVIDSADKPYDDRRVTWLFKNPLSDGGQFTGVADIVTKYGVVPWRFMPETYTTEHTSTFSRLLGWKLREWGLQLRDKAANGATDAQLQADKTEMLSQVYRMLTMNFGTPPETFVSNGKKYTPVTYYNELFGNDLQNNYVMFMNDPTSPYYKLYEIDLDRHMYDGKNWTYINVPMSEIKQMAIASIKDSTAMYFSCDVGKYLDRKNGTLDLDNYDYSALMGTTFNMDKAQRIMTGASGSTHAMTLCGVDLNDEDKPVKWLIENSWGADSGKKGYLVATDRWMDEYLFRLVVERKFVPEKLLKILNSKPTLLPPWDPMY